jgi:hypothetical protein
MNQKYLAFGIAAVAAYYYFSTKTSTTAQAVPLVSSLYNLGYNLAAGTFSFTSPVATS